jgi:hypothetical protein
MNAAPYAFYCSRCKDSHAGECPPAKPANDNAIDWSKVEIDRPIVGLSGWIPRPAPPELGFVCKVDHLRNEVTISLVDPNGSGRFVVGQGVSVEIP